MKTRLWAAKESVTGDLASERLSEPGSNGSLNWENTCRFPADVAGVTLYAKASRAPRLHVAAERRGE